MQSYQVVVSIMPEILLVSEVPAEYGHLIKQLEAAGVCVHWRRTLSTALELVRDSSSSSLTVVSETKGTPQGDQELLTELNGLHPRVQTILFSNDESQQAAAGRLHGLDKVRIVARPLRDPTSHRLILDSMYSNAAQKVVQPFKSSAGTGTNGAHAGSAERSGSIYPAGANHYTEEFLRRVGLSDVPVLLHGETGVGKEVMARRLWAYSSRSDKPFFKLNCTALPSDLIESELFGYDKGAFTGATADKPGKFELAQNGTILLDEIGDMDIRLQAKLLQVLQDGEVQPLGSARLIKVNVRVMAATHRDLRAAIAQGSFREDLYYRLSVINITIPPLRERRDEILTLAEKLLLRHMATGSTAPEIPENLSRAMLAHPWPGNVRELENLMRRFLIYQDANLLAVELTDSLAASRRRRATDRIAEVPRVPMSFNHLAEASRTAESRLLIETLESARWNRRQAAMRLNLDYKALLYKLRKYGIVEGKAKQQQRGA
jgi:DNA-binding NtrC family response regulator